MARKEETWVLTKSVCSPSRSKSHRAMPWRMQRFKNRSGYAPVTCRRTVPRQ